MLHTDWIASTQEQLPVTIRALRSITREQVSTVEQALAAQGDLWSVDQHEDYDGYVSLMVSQNANGAMFVISGEAEKIELSGMQDDALHMVGIYQTIQEALQQLVAG